MHIRPRAKHALGILAIGVPRRTIDDPYLDPYLDPHPRKGVWVKAKGVWVIYGVPRHPLKVHTAICTPRGPPVLIYFENSYF